MAAIHLFVPMLHRRDAVGEHTRTLHRLLLAAGIPSTIYTEHADPETADETRPYLEYEKDAAPGDLLVYQVATRSDMVAWLGSRPERVVLNYHSITPAAFFTPWNNGIARMQAAALVELAHLAPRSVLGIGVSEFDAAELRTLGCRVTRVVPVANVPSSPVEPDQGASEVLARRKVGTGPWWLSVGRLAPNKAHEDTIAALFVARSNGWPDARLTIVGGPIEQNYAGALRRYAADLGMSRAVEFVTRLTPGELASRYEAADVLVMLSEHEGFGVPLVEAMSHGVPIVAFDAGAVAEILGGAGVLLTDKGPRRVADAVGDLLADDGERAALVAAGRTRIAELGLEHAGSDLVRVLAEVADGEPKSLVRPVAGGPLRPGRPSSH